MLVGGGSIVHGRVGLGGDTLIIVSGWGCEKPGFYVELGGLIEMAGRNLVSGTRVSGSRGGGVRNRVSM